MAVPTSSDNSQTVEVIDLEAADADGGMPAAQSSLVVQAEFDEMVLWGHDVAVDAVDGEAGASDPYMRAVGEWVAVAERVSLILVLPSYLGAESIWAGVADL